MSTRSIIAIDDAGDIEYIWCNYDGYPETDGERGSNLKISVGQTLKYNYTTQEQVKELMKMGWLSSLYPDIGLCVRYFNTDGDLTPSKTIPACDIWDEPRYGAEYLYLFQDGVWYYKPIDTSQEKIDRDVFMFQEL